MNSKDKDRFNFRFWHTPSKKMLDCYGFNEHYTFADTLDGIGTEYNPCKTSDCVLMQCTGLRDKNGNLIYEGDILRVNTGSRDTSGYGVVEYLQCGCKFIVTGYLDNPSGYYPRKKGELCRNLEEWLCTEVIGNIYENPELLEEGE